ncbi:hypothetical protein V6N13_089004 [Hibiscus sabdariffa]|uniref:Uncharacterized protein n=1 Tax=Hibiscus sabdariffa TaxID=183260 RepID=A0ABR2G232_9ROSI
MLSVGSKGLDLQCKCPYLSLSPRNPTNTLGLSIVHVDHGAVVVEWLHVPVSWVFLHDSFTVPPATLTYASLWSSELKEGSVGRCESPMIPIANVDFCINSLGLPLEEEEGRLRTLIRDKTKTIDLGRCGLSRDSFSGTHLVTRSRRCGVREWKPGLSDGLRGQDSCPKVEKVLIVHDEGSIFGIHGVVQLKKLSLYDFSISWVSRWLIHVDFDVVSYRVLVLLYMGFRKPIPLSRSRVTAHSSFESPNHSRLWKLYFHPRHYGVSNVHILVAVAWRRKMTATLKLLWDFICVFLFLPASTSKSSSEPDL